MIQRIGTFLTGLFIGLLTAGLLLLFIDEPQSYPIQLLPPPTQKPIQVHVAGAVANPGVFEVPEGSIIQIAVDMAGGPLEDAALDAVNLAATVEDGQQVFIPTRSVTPANPSSGGSVVDPLSGEKINVNTASTPELEILPGIGPSLASKIIEYREAHGRFNVPDDLLAVPGIGPAKLEEIRDLITY